MAGEYQRLARDYNAALDRLEEIETREAEIKRKMAEQSPGPSAAACASGGGGGAGGGRGRVDSESDSGASGSASAGADGANSARRGSRRLFDGAAGSQGVAPAVRPRSEESARGDVQSKRPRNGARV